MYNSDSESIKVKSGTFDIACSISMIGKNDSGYPSIVKTYRQRYDKMATSEYKRKLTDYAESVLHDPLEGSGWRQLLDWEHKHLKYTKGKLLKKRAELPIDIIQHAKGKCGEFALLYNGLLLAHGYKTRLVIDCSTLQNKSRKSAGDHVWVEVLVDNAWLHVDPTEKRIGQPLMYARDWRKDVNLVYAISEEEVVDVTGSYTA
jgi:hypothetical protein